jgi:hypothetical protein
MVIAFCLPICKYLLLTVPKMKWRRSRPLVLYKAPSLRFKQYRKLLCRAEGKTRTNNSPTEVLYKKAQTISAQFTKQGDALDLPELEFTIDKSILEKAFAATSSAALQPPNLPRLRAASAQSCYRSWTRPMPYRRNGPSHRAN